jgi:hypothetical protein
MANTYKTLGQSNPSAATLTTLYTVPAVTSTIVSTITVCNRSATATTFRIAFRLAGAAIDNAHYVAYDAEILGNEVYTFTIGATMATTDVLSVYATLATLTFVAFGQEIT